MKISAFSIVKNEAQFIGYGVMSLLPYVDEIVYADGGSTDGTLKLLDYIKEKYAGDKLRILRGWDCKDMKGDYVRLFNDLMKECKGEYLWYCHPDMILVEPGVFASFAPGALAYYVNMRSFAGEDLGLEITKGRTDKWKTVMKNDLGLHYWGQYGDANEDMYFKEITGNEHVVCRNVKEYPYRVNDSKTEIWHFCECKPKARRIEKMEKVIKTVAGDSVNVDEITSKHPRVTLDASIKTFGEFEFKRREDPLPEVFERYKEEFEAVLK